MKERRKARRVSLDAMLFCTLEVQGERKVEAVVTDASPEGLRLGFPSAEDTDLLQPGDRVTFVESSEEAAILEGLDATVIWVKEGACGVSLPEGVEPPQGLLKPGARKKP